MVKKIVFEWFPQYRFLETEIVNYPILYRDFISYERPESYYFITLLNKSENVQVTLLVRFLFIKHSILTTSLYRNSNEKKEVHIIE